MYLEKKALVLGAGGNVSQGIIKAIRESELPIKIYGACINSYSKGLYMSDEAYICPYASDEMFIPWVINFCNEKDIDIVFSGVEENIIQLAKNEELFKQKTRAVFVSSTYEQLVVGQDKYLTCEFLKNAGCNYPMYQLLRDRESIREFVEKVGYPIIAKPRNGKGSKGLLVIQSIKDVEKISTLDNYVLEQCIGTVTSEYTIGCYVDKKGALQKMIPMRRRLYNGTTVWAETVEEKAIEEECIKICNAFKPKGPLNIQLRKDFDGKPVCFELNVRFSGTTAIRTHFGYQDVKAMILEYLYDEDIEGCFNYVEGEVFRYDAELYLHKGTTELIDSQSKIVNVKDRLF